MLTVTVCTIYEVTHKTVVEGQLYWKGKKKGWGAITVSDTDNFALLHTAVDPIRLSNKGELPYWIFPEDEPELFMRSLYIWYSGAYFSCSPAEET